MNKLFMLLLCFVFYSDAMNFPVPIPVIRLVARSAGTPFASYTNCSERDQMRRAYELRKKLESFNQENAKQG